MWRRKSLLFWCTLLLLITSSSVFCQTHQPAPIKASLSADSLGVRATQITKARHPARIGVPSVGLERTMTPSQLLQGPLLAPEAESQWVKLHFSGTAWNWYMRKPGTYAGEILTGSVESNGKVSVGFERFNELRCTDGSGQSLDTYYAISPPGHTIGKLKWIEPYELNAFDLYFEGVPVVPAGWALWQKVVVENSAPAAEFQDGAFISVSLLNQSEWIENIGEDQDKGVKPLSPER
jgi:hypothetical protein